MKRRFRRAAALLLAVCLLVSSGVLPAEAYNPSTVDQLNTHVNTGNQRRDIVAIALTQVGYQEGDRNDTKYGDWYGMPHEEWCAMFVSWCARQAEVSTDIIAKTSWAHPNSFHVTEYSGTEYTPQPGDLFFTENHEHVGLVWYVDGEFFYSVEGNAKPHDYTVPNDPTVESYHVMTNKRLISAHTFGVPEYQGGEPGHTYERCVESSHPHKVYYRCSDCGDQYYTGYTDRVAGCSSCFACGCNTSKAGYYELTPAVDYLRIRTGHSWSSQTLCYVTVGSVLYVYGIGSDGWAYIEFDGIRGHIPAAYLQPYPDPPDAPAVQADQTGYWKHDTATLTWDLPANTEQFRLEVLLDGQLYCQQRLDLAQSYTLTDLAPGRYQVRLIACNRAGVSAPGTLEFTVEDTYTVTYNTGLGTGAPESQCQVMGQAVTVAAGEPTREGYQFLGWTPSADGNVAELYAGDAFLPVGDTTLRAVWLAQNAQPQTLTLRKAPDTTVYLPGDSLEPAGMVLELVYSDGAGHTVTDGFQISGFETETLGTKTLTVTYAGLETTCQVEVIAYIPGDMDGNRAVNRDDVIRLLLHITMPEDFPISIPADFTGDGQVTRDDVIQLLLHVTMPEDFPLQTAA